MNEEAEKLKEQRRLKRNASRSARAARNRGFAEAEALEATRPPPTELDLAALLDPKMIQAQVLEAYGQLGGVAGLVLWGRKYPKEFYALFGRVVLSRLPKEPAESGAGTMEDILSTLSDDESENAEA